MKRNLLHKAMYAFTCVLLLNSNSLFAVARTWTGIGAGGAGTDFNNVANWTGGGALAAGDDFTINWTANVNGTIALSANITVNTLTFNVNTSVGGFGSTGQLNVGAFLLTVNGAANFNSVAYLTPTNFDVLKLNVNTGGNIIFNGDVHFHTTGSGDSYLVTNNTAGGGATTGTVTFNGNLYIGIWGRTVGAYEPDIVFNGAGAQLVVVKCSGGAYMFKAQDLTFGTTNAPTVTIRGPGAVYFNCYDGNMAVGANTTVIVPDSTSVGYMTLLNRYTTGAGTMTMGANSTINTGCPNKQPLKGFATYTFSATSTVNYNSAGWQDMFPITYGNVICDGTGSTGWKYSNGVQTMQGNFTIQNSAIYGPWLAGGLTINGNTLIQSSGTFNATQDNIVSGITHTLKGNYTNNATFTSGSPVGINTMLFNSTTVGQSIGGSSVSTFYNLTNDNTSGLGATLNQNENVANVWTLTNGPVNLNTYTLTIQNTATTAVVRTNGYAVSETNAAVNNSRVQWNMTAANTGAHVYPFGVSGTYIPFTFNKTSTVNPVNVAVSTRATSTNDNTPYAGVSSVAAVTNMSSYALAGANGSIPSVIDRWWDIVASAAVTGDLIFTYRGSENTTTLAPTGGFRAQHWNGSAWDPPVGAGTGVTAGTGTVSVTGASTFSPWILSSISAPLPIELLSFEAHAVDGQVNLAWKTATEINNDYFTIEKSKDGQNFEPALKTDGAGNSTSEISYYDIDPNPYTGVSYYRLKQTDFNGKFSYSNIVPVEYNSNGESTISLFPNPSDAGTATYISLNDFKGEEVLVVLRDITGRELFSKVIIGTSNNELVAVDPQGIIAKGSYLITASSANKFYSKKLIIK